ncbi:MAG: hypothetical protein ACJ0O0_06565 [Flavobacteriaceae bacterium]
MNSSSSLKMGYCWKKPKTNFRILRKKLKIGDDSRIFIADSSDLGKPYKTGNFQDLKSYAQLSAPMLNTGLYLVEACVEATGTNYCDITGETQWIRQIIDKYHSAVL